MKANTYRPITCVWEVTMGCNMRCKHCGSSCSEPLPDELTTEEALSLCRQIAGLGLKWITLSGGEPLTRKDIPALTNELSRLGVAVNLITNGWLLDDKMAGLLKESGISTVAISIDGTEALHDTIRKPGAFARARQAFSALTNHNMEKGAITTVTKQNIGNLEELKETLISMNVDSWQVQLGLPMGNLKERPDWVLDPKQMDDIIDFCHKTAREGRIKIFPADCIGYYTKKELEVKRISYGTNQVSLWDGCNAGVRGFGILHNGDILGCTSIRSKEFVEGNIKDRSLRSIWEDKNAFTWRRNMQKEELGGLCKTCNYGSKCLGGCPNTRLTMNGSIYGENEYCAYHVELTQLQAKYQNHEDPESLFSMAQEKIQHSQFQEASLMLDRVIALLPEYSEAYKAKGFCEYMCGNYELCKAANTKALDLHAEDAYALRGYGIAVYKLGDVSGGIRSLTEAAIRTNWQDRDILEDLHLMQHSISQC